MPAAKSSRKTQPIKEVHTLHKSTCPTSTGKSKLGYKVGSDGDGEVHFKIISNTGGGFFSEEWVALSAIQAAFEAQPEDQPLTSFALAKLFQGKSANNSGFLCAVLLAEGLLERDGDNKRIYQACDPKSFLAEIRKLLAADKGKAPKTEAPARRKAKPSPTRRKAAPRTRKTK